MICYVHFHPIHSALISVSLKYENALNIHWHQTNLASFISSLFYFYFFFLVTFICFNTKSNQFRGIWMGLVSARQTKKCLVFACGAFLSVSSPNIYNYNCLNCSLILCHFTSMYAIICPKIIEGNLDEKASDDNQWSMTDDHLIYVCRVLYMHHITKIPKQTGKKIWNFHIWTFKDWFALNSHALKCQKCIRIWNCYVFGRVHLTNMPLAALFKS